MRRHVHDSHAPGPSGRHSNPPRAVHRTESCVRATLAGLLGLVVLGLLIGGCSASSQTDDIGGRVLVSAAASLTDAFTTIEAAFEQRNVGVDVVLNVAGSATLRTQILEGAPGDVFAPSGLNDMRTIVEAGETINEPQIFAKNLLQIAVPTGNPGSVTSLIDFADDNLFIGLCAENVPCGHFARLALEKAGVRASVDTNEPNVRALLTKVEVGELDAGIVYVTDIASTDGVEGIAIPPDHNVVADYPIVVLADSTNPTAASAFVAFVVSGEGQRILADHGFSAP